MVYAVSHQVGERVPHGFNDCFINFDFVPFDFENAFLTEFCAQVAYNPREATENRSDGLHARLHDSFLQFTGDLVDARSDVVEPLAGA